MSFRHFILSLTLFGSLSFSALALPGDKAGDQNRRPVPRFDCDPVELLLGLSDQQQGPDSYSVRLNMARWPHLHRIHPRRWDMPRIIQFLNHWRAEEGADVEAMKREGVDRDLQWDGIDENYGPPKGELVVVEDQDRNIQATAGITKISDDVVEFRKFYVDSGQRRQQLGESILLACIERAREMGAKQLKLKAREQFEGAIKLYEKTGFVVERRDPATKAIYFSLDL